MSAIDDERIKQLISIYQQRGDGYKEIVEVTSQYIYNFPLIKFKADEDMCGDFYLYFMERFDKLLLKYDIMDCRFTSWLIVVLTGHYFNWVKKVAKNTSHKHVVFLEDFLAHNIDQEIHSSEGRDETTKELLSKVLNSLPVKLKIVMKLYYFDFFEGADLKEISEIYNKEIPLLIQKYDHILDHVSTQYIKEKELQDELNKAYHKLLQGEENLAKQMEKLSGEERGQLTMKIEKYKERHMRLLAQYKKFRITVKYELMSDLLGVKENAIHNLVYRGKSLLKQKFKDAKLW